MEQLQNVRTTHDFLKCRPLQIQWSPCSSFTLAYLNLQHEGGHSIRLSPGYTETQASKTSRPGVMGMWKKYSLLCQRTAHCEMLTALELSCGWVGMSILTLTEREREKSVRERER